jgi:hypothetical protein
MHTFGVIALIVILGGFVLARLVRRVSERTGQVLSYASHLTARIAVVVIGGWAGVVALGRGSWWVALGVLLLLIAVGAVAMAAIFLIGIVQTIRGGEDANHVKD